MRGEADFTFPLLVNEITRTKLESEQLKAIPGVMSLDNGHLFVNREYPSLTRNQLETLDFSYCCMYEGDMVSLLTERGCPMDALFVLVSSGKGSDFINK